MKPTQTQTETPSKETFEVVEPVESTGGNLPSKDDLKGKGWTSDEIERAEKRGMIAKPETPEEKTQREAEAKAKADTDAKAKADAGKAENKDGAEAKDDKGGKSSLPDFTFQTPEQEKAFLEAFGPGTPQRAMYFRMKNDRSAKQAERAGRIAAEKKLEEYEARFKALEAKDKQTIDEEGNIIDPDDKPLTMRELKALQKEQAEAAEKKNKETQDRAGRVVEAQVIQEDYARGIHPDFDATMKLSEEVLKSLETLVPERWKQAQVVSLIKQLQVAAGNADQIDLDDFHAPLIAYEIGKFHPKYGQRADAANDGDKSEIDGKSNDPKKGSGALTPEQMERIEKNTQRRTSSASVQGGGGTRTISADNVDPATLNKMSYRQRQKFREQFPDRYVKLMRG